MNKELIEQLAREAHFNVADDRINDGTETAADFTWELERFAGLVAARCNEIAQRQVAAAMLEPTAAHRLSVNIDDAMRSVFPLKEA